MRIVLPFAVAAAALTLAAGAGAASPAQMSRHDRDLVRFFDHHPRLARTPAGARELRRIIGHLETTIRTLQTARVSACGTASASACAWYEDGATQCEVSHEGGFTSLSPDGKYAGRFQSDYSFETETAFGRMMESRYGRANRWPIGAQIDHAFEVWSYSGWSRWPPYYRYGCSAFRGGTYR